MALSGSLFFLMDGAGLAQAGESVQGESTVQSMDMDRHDHAEGTVDMMNGKTKGSGMFFTRLSPAIGSCCPLVFSEAPFVSHDKSKTSHVSHFTSGKPRKPPTVSGSCSSRSFLLSELHACHQSIR